MAFTAQLSTGIVPTVATDWSAAGCVFGRMQVVDADVRIYVQEVRAVHTAAGDGGMRAAVRLPGMRRACPPCPPDRTRLPHHVGRRASGRRKVRAHHRRIARRGKIARSRMQLLRRPRFQDGETGQGESVSASLTNFASQVPSSINGRRLGAPSGHLAAWPSLQELANRDSAQPLLSARNPPAPRMEACIWQR
jgi:hypothetical protein